jgi:chromosome segregation ATPase
MPPDLIFSAWSPAYYLQLFINHYIGYRKPRKELCPINIHANAEVPPTLFTERLKSQASGNQAIYKDSLFKKAVIRSIDSAKSDLLAAAERHSEKLSELDESHSKMLEGYLLRQGESAEEILSRLQSMERSNRQLADIVDKKASEQEKWNEQQSIQETMILELSRKLDKLMPAEGHLQEQQEMKDKIDSLASFHEMTHSTIMERLDKQEDLLQKLSRHYEELRAGIQDRFAAVSSFLEDRFYQLTQPVQRFVIKEKHGQKEQDEKTIV